MAGTGRGNVTRRRYPEVQMNKRENTERPDWWTFAAFALAMLAIAMVVFTLMMII
jgi:hypothetical protein